MDNLASDNFVEDTEEFRSNLKLLNSTLCKALRYAGANMGIEGNVFYRHSICSKGDVWINASPEPAFRIKRDRLTQCVRLFDSPTILEVGVNGSHSAMLMLMANPKCKYIGVDIAKHWPGSNLHHDIYVPAGIKLLQQLFPGRVSFFQGDSAEVVSSLTQFRHSIDILHIDGAKKLYRRDFLASLPLLIPSKTYVVFDDTDHFEGNINVITVNTLLKEGYIQTLDEFPELTVGAANTVLRVLKTHDMSKSVEKPFLFLYWENRANTSKPAYLDLCYETILKHAATSGAFDVVLLNEKSIKQFLPNLPEKLNSLPHIAQKADYIRVALIHEYGGFWLDSDTIMMKTPQPWTELLKTYDVVWASEQCFGAPKASPFTEKVMKRLNDKLAENKNNYYWEELGRKGCIDPVFQENEADPKLKIYTIPQDEVTTLKPIPWSQDNDQTGFISKTLDAADYYNRDQVIVRLHNKVYPESFKKLTKDEVLSSETLLADFLKFSLGMSMTLVTPKEVIIDGLSVCCIVKNRTNIFVDNFEPETRRAQYVPSPHMTKSITFESDGTLNLKLFENSIRSLCEIYTTSLKDTSSLMFPLQIVVCDWSSTDVNMESLCKEVNEKYPDVLITCVSICEEGFNRGKARNIALKNAIYSSVLFLDADMIITKPDVLQTTVQATRNRQIYFPICFSFKNPQHSEGWWRKEGYGIVGGNKKAFEENAWPEYNVHGKEDNDLYTSFEKSKIWSVFRNECPGLFHQWHPTTITFKDRFATTTTN
jgi:hypothetical protein